jgi:hypothetical protein
MIPYGISIKDRRPMYDYRADKYNSRGCFNVCNCVLCRNKKTEARKNTNRIKSSTLSVQNRMRSAKKKSRQEGNRLIINETKN